MTWSPVAKFSFRFFSVYLVLFIFSMQFVFLQLLMQWWERVLPWFVNTVLRLPIPVRYTITGSGDTTFHYFLVLFFAVLALISAITWSVLDRKRDHYRRLLNGLVVLV